MVTDIRDVITFLIHQYTNTHGSFVIIKKSDGMNIKTETTLPPELVKQLKSFIYDIIGCCQEVHREMGPYLNEYIYQDALEMCFQERKIDFIREHHFKTLFHNKPVKHTHQVDFFCKNNVYVECKAIATLSLEQRQQLWNYMRLGGVRIGILYNFAPVNDQCERYYYDPEKKTIAAF